MLVVEANEIDIALIHNMLPPEMLEKILELLIYKEIRQAKLICRRWKEIIDKGNLLKKASGKIFETLDFFIKLITNIVLIMGFCLFHF